MLGDDVLRVELLAPSAEYWQPHSHDPRLDMAEISDSRKKEIIDALSKRKAQLPCPRCANQSFSLVGGYFNQPIQTELGGLVIGGPSVPSVVVVCNQCGFMSQHALGALGLLPAEANPSKPGDANG
jgi:hypothetical protein